MHLFIFGLRRSGTTVVWQTFRQDRRMVGINEPFNPALAELPEELPNGSRAEMIEIFRRDPKRFWRVFAPIPRAEELQETLSDRQRGYFRFLLEACGSMVMDATRCHFKLEELHALAPEAACLHLYRAPAAFATSHLVPGGSGGFRGGTWRRARGRLGFWSARGGFNNWGVEEIISTSPEALFGQRVQELGLDSMSVYQLPAIGRLLAFWRVMYERVEADGRRLYGDRFLSLSLESFCADPGVAVEAVYSRLGASAPALDFSAIRSAPPAHAPRDPRWGPLLRAVGLPDR